jgi:hypothetical protein
MQAPFPWFGGKSRVAHIVWGRLGDVPNYVEPFFGSGAVLLGRPHAPNIETVNDKDAYLANFWRAIKADPETVAHYADWPVNESDMHARHIWLLNTGAERLARIEGDPDYYDAQVAGWWVWGICAWIGPGWCSGNGPWHSVDGKLVRLSTDGRGVHRQLVHLGDGGQGVHRQLVHLGNGGQGVHRKQLNLTEWFAALSERLRRVRVCVGDWSRVLRPTPTVKLGLTGVFLDPPYNSAARNPAIYNHEDSGHLAADVREWAIAHGDDPMMRIALCGYDDFTMPDAWVPVAWKTNGGYANQGNNRGKENRHRERIWFSPHCLSPTRPRQALLDVLD